MNLDLIRAKFESYDSPKNGDCTEWAGPLHGKGYGCLYVCNEKYKAHRAAYLIYKGEIPEGLCVLHTCDNRCCVNPEHLYIGTNSDNVRDRTVRGRGGDHNGDKNGNARFGWKEADEIRISTEKRCVLARRYGVSGTTISYIRKGKSWRRP